MVMVFAVIMKFQDVQLLVIVLMIQQLQMMMGLVQDYLLERVSLVL